MFRLYRPKIVSFIYLFHLYFFSSSSSFVKTRGALPSKDAKIGQLREVKMSHNMKLFSKHFKGNQYPCIDKQRLARLLFEFVIYGYICELF